MPPVTKSNLGQAAEFFVAADFLKRGLQGTKPLNINGDDDLHVKCAGVWYTVQIKHGTLDGRTKRLNCKKSQSKMSSDILAVVHLPTKRIDYRPIKTSVPKELTE